jgi:hypothetical protein
LENTNETKQNGSNGEIRYYPSEEIIFERLKSIQKIFSAYEVKTKISVIVSDYDLDYCFPTIQNIVSFEDIKIARISIQKYMDYLRNEHPEINEIKTLTEILKERKIESTFQKNFEMIVSQGENGGGKNINEKILEMRVNNQFEHYTEMFRSYTRDLARYTAIRQISNIISLSTVFESFESTPILAIDSRGFENQLIGGLNPESVIKFFTKIKDPTQVFSDIVQRRNK